MSDALSIEKIRSQILAKPIFAAIKTTCSYCIKFLSTIDRLNLKDSLQVVDDVHHAALLKNIRNVVSEVYRHHTVPIVFVNGRFVGGNDSFESILGRLKAVMDIAPLDQSLVLTESGKLPK
ncbi:glutaredoxin 3 [Nematocida major]|uniref:glutaredoxin 3 n=1 Tax=Nematocida major TaxID=1912982 RepID=UPI002008B1F0|nr:glutaredoxin 3 [Nematocida major]KAH9386065.1 glutaredoxin 3 [Nematocida major]